MTRTLAERAADPFWWGEQFAHLAIGFAPAFLAALLYRTNPVLGGVFLGLWVAGLREFEQRPVGSWGDLLVDVGFTVAGGAVGGAVAMVIAR